MSQSVAQPLVYHDSVTRQFTVMTVVVGPVALVVLRSQVQFDVIRDRHTLYREINAQILENLHTVEIDNKDARPHTYGLSGTLRDSNENRRLIVTPSRISLQAEKSRSVVVSVDTEHKPERAIDHVHFTLQAEDTSGNSATRTARFPSGGQHHDD